MYKKYRMMRCLLIKKITIICCGFQFGGQLMAQQIDFGNIGRGKPFKVSGTVAANTVYYNSNQIGSLAVTCKFFTKQLIFLRP